MVVYIGIGSNLGNRRRNILLAVQGIADSKDTEVLKLSKLIETDPVGGPLGQRKFLNAALKIATDLSPESLLERLQAIERKLGRVRSVHHGPRTVDLDILFYGDKVIQTKRLQVPHPRMGERDFVIKPLLELL